MKSALMAGGLMLVLMASSAWAIPTLQVGALAGTGDTGIYADYVASLTNPPETDTAVTGGTSLVAVGSYGTSNQTPPAIPLLLGGQYLTGDNGSNFGFATAFDTKGAVIMATVPQADFLDGYTLTVGGASAFYTTLGFESGFVMPNPPSNHDPVKDSAPNKAYLFFDIGNFASNLGPVYNLADETGSDTYGEEKRLALVVDDLAWAHFDLFALLTDTQGQTRLVTNLEGNPGSKDLTWKDGGGGGGGDPIPEPSTFILLGSGLLGLFYAGRKRSKS
jgi:hypothetical protein